MINRQHIVARFLWPWEGVWHCTHGSSGILLGPFQGGSEGPHADFFISHFLREQTTQDESRLYSLSDPYDQEMRVPQGSILSVALFRLKNKHIISQMRLNPGMESSLICGRLSGLLQVSNNSDLYWKTTAAISQQVAKVGQMKTVSNFLKPKPSACTLCWPLTTMWSRLSKKQSFWVFCLVKQTFHLFLIWETCEISVWKY